MSAVLLIAVPLLTAFISILVKKVSPYLLILVSLFAFIYPYFMDMNDVIIGGFESPIGINLIVNTYTLTALYVVNGLFFLVVAVNISNFKKMSSILLVALAGLNGLLLTGDLFNLFVFIEISSIAAYLITTTNKQPLHTFNYLVAGTVGSSLYLLGLIILYNMSGTLNMSEVATFVTTANNGMYTLFPFLLMFIGLGVEAKLLPFNSWVKGILGHSNNLTGSMIASVYATAIALVFGRLLNSVFYISGDLALIVMIVLLITILAGEAMAYASSKAREILLFSSIAQAGIVALLFVSGFVGWAVMFAIANGVSKFILFGVINRLTEGHGTDEVDHLKGAFVQNKVIGVAFTIAALSIMGLPVFFGFVAKMNSLTSFFIYGSNLPGGEYLFVIAILVASVIEGVYFVKLLTKLWYKKETTKVNFTPIFKYVVVVLALALIVFGLWTEEVTELVNTMGGVL